MRAIVPALLAALLMPGIAGAVPDRPAGTGLLPEPVARLLAERSAPLRAEALSGVGRRPAAQKAPAALETIVISCDFADSLMFGRYGQVAGTFPPPRQTDRHYAAHDSVFLHHKLQDVAAYFADVSGGALEIRVTVHPRTVNLPHPMSWYGNHPTLGDQPVALAADVVDSLDQEIDFTRYDTVVLVHAGAGEETDILGDSPEQIYSTYLNPADFEAAWQDSLLAQPYLPAAGFAPGTGIDRVLVLPETAQQDPFGTFRGGFGSLGIYCFEFGLHLGMLSLSDFTPSGRPDSQGVGQYDLMGYGLFVGLGFIPPQPGPLNKLLMGWLSPYTADPDGGGTIALAPAADVAGGLACARIEITGQEYWLAEYRLQDPDGNRRFGFPGDLNGNGLPDFWDDDSANGDGTPTGKFDPATDTHEDLRGAEWDFAMSENNARQVGELGAGSGVYIWHVDEGVIAAVFGGTANLFNADPAHKAVDLEEADGVQDLDSSEPSAWQLGGDDDSFRGEDNHRFGPDTRPDTRSNGGLATGVVMRDFSNVVRDSAAYEVVVGEFTYPGYDYADTMTFVLERAVSGAGERLPAARRALPAGVDLTGSHLMAVDLDGAGGHEIVVADRQGSVWAFTGGLDEFLDRDDHAATMEPLATGLRANATVDWLLPAAAGDVDGDGVPEIVVASTEGLYAFEADGSAIRDLGAADHGLYADVAGCSQAVVLLPTEAESLRGDPAARVTAVVAWARAGACGLEFRGGADGDLEREITLGTGHVTSVPQVFGTWLLVCVADTVAGSGRLAVIDLAAEPLPSTPEVVEVALRGVPGPWPAMAGFVTGTGGASPQVFVMVPHAAGAGETVVLDASRNVASGGYAWPGDAGLAGPVSPGGAVFGGEQLARIGQGGDWLDGWPRSETPAAVGGPAGVLMARIVDAPDGYEHYLFSATDGRLLVRGARGEEVSGWPLQGPAACAGTPSLGMFGGGADADLAAVGSFARLVGNADGGAELVTSAASEIAVWHDVASLASRWPMWGGSAWRSGAWDAAGFIGVPAVAAGAGLVPGSHFCYPNPLTGGTLGVRAQVRASGRARVTIHDLGGEQVLETPWQDVAAVEPFSLEVDLTGVASGMYFCRLVVSDDAGGSDVSVVTFAVAH
jgi:M6 family metalloprotease-like protein